MSTQTQKEKPVRILCYGDSDTYGHDPVTHGRYPADSRWPGALQLLLGDRYKVLEEGLNGRTALDFPGNGTRNGFEFLDVTLRKTRGCDVFIVMLGSNDLAKAYGADADMIAGGVGRITDYVLSFAKKHKKKKPELIIMSPAYFGGDFKNSIWAEYYDERGLAEVFKLAPALKKTAAEKGALFLDTAPFCEVSSADSLHITAASHRRIAEHAAVLIRQLCGEGAQVHG